MAHLAWEKVPRLLVVGLVDRPRLLSTWRLEKGIIAIESAIWAGYV